VWLGPRGTGRIWLRPVAGDVRVIVKLRGLDGGCEGQRLTLGMRLRITRDDCIGGAACTTDSLESLGECVVVDGRCTIKSTVNTFRGGPFLLAGKRTGIEVMSDCAMFRGTFTRLPFRCGILIP
jgi:hypothetical protein